MANLFEINKEMMEALEKSIDPETGEIVSDELLEKFEELQIARDEKIENTACYIKNLQADADAYKQQKEAFAEREKQAKKKIDNLKKYLTLALNGEKFESTRCKLSFRKSEKVNVIDMSLLDDSYYKYKDPEVDLTKVKKALKDGVELKGVELVENQNIQIK